MTLFKQKIALVEDYTIWILIGLVILVIGSIMTYLALRKGLINLDFAKNLFR